MLRAWLKPGDLLLLIMLLLPLAVGWSRLAAGAGAAPGDTLTTLGRAAGILALAMMLLAGALSVRLPSLDRFFGGLTRLWKRHHLLGFGAFILVMLHVLLLGFGALPLSVDSAVRTLFPPLSATAVWLGWPALLVLVLFLAPSFKFFGPPHYQRWKWLHMTASPTALLLALAHALPLTPETAAWWLLGALALGASGWRLAGSRWLGRRPHTITAVTPLTSDAVEISLRPESRAITYQPGQFVYLTPADPALAAGRNEEHPFTISSAPAEELLRIGIKDLGDASHALQRVSIGSRAWVEGPYGELLTRLFPQRGQLWLGGGIGITPFVSGLRALRHQGSAPAGGIHLFFLANDLRRTHYLEELSAIARQIEGVAVTPHYFAEQGPITAEFLVGHCPDFVDREVYICGPPPMQTHLREVLRRAGVPAARIHREEFNFL